MKDKEYLEKFGERLKRLLADGELTQTDAARNLGVSKRTMNTWCNGTVAMPVDVLFRLCEHNGFDPYDLLGLPVDEAYMTVRMAREATGMEERTCRKVLGLSPIAKMYFNEMAYNFAEIAEKMTEYAQTIIDDNGKIAEENKRLKELLVAAKPESKEPESEE